MKKNYLIKNEDFINMLGKLSDREVAEKWGVSVNFVWALRLELKIEPARKHGKSHGTAKLPVREDLQKEFDAVRSLTKLANKYGVSRQAVYERLKRE